MAKCRKGTAPVLALVGGLLLAPGAMPLAVAQINSCLLEPSSDVEIGTPAQGVLVEVAVDRSDAVARGDLLARLNDGVERAAIQVQETRAAFNRRHLERTEDLGAQRMMSDQEIDEIRTDYELARGELARAREELALRAIRSPIDGVVVERRFGEGDLVQAEPVFRLMALDPLHVEVVLPVGFFGTLEMGSEKIIWLPEIERTVSARIINIDRVIDPRSSTFRVRLELPNPGLAIPSGLRCEFIDGEMPGAGAQIPQ